MTDKGENRIAAVVLGLIFIGVGASLFALFTWGWPEALATAWISLGVAVVGSAFA